MFLNTLKSGSRNELEGMGQMMLGLSLAALIIGTILAVGFRNQKPDPSFEEELDWDDDLYGDCH